MKIPFNICFCVAALSFSPLCAGDSENKSISIEQRLAQTDLSIVLRQYEQVMMEVFSMKLKGLELVSLNRELELKRKAGKADSDLEKEQMLLDWKLKGLADRQDDLEKLARELRHRALLMGSDLEALARDQRDRALHIEKLKKREDHGGHFEIGGSEKADAKKQGE